MINQRSVVFEVVESGVSQTTDILNEVKKTFPNIKRSTVRGRLSELKSKNLVKKNNNGYRTV